MIHVHAMYEKRSSDDRFDLEYLVQKRIPYVKQLLGPYGLDRIVVHAGIAGIPPGTPPKYCCMIVLSFETQAGFEEAFRREAVRLNAGIGDFTNIEPVVMVSEVASS